MFKITHRQGNRMSHVDALSRIVGYIGELPLEQKLDFQQLADPFLARLSEELEIEDNDKFCLINDLVDRKFENQRRLVVPEA